jgi:hypothetical protein
MFTHSIWQLRLYANKKAGQALKSLSRFGLEFRGLKDFGTLGF